MNIELQCCSLFVIFIIYLLFSREKKLNLTNNKLFTRSLYSCIIVVMLDVISIVCIYLSVNHNFNPSITQIICKLYIFALVLQGYFGYVYVMTELLTDSKYMIIKRILHLLFTFGELAILGTPISFTMGRNYGYSYGISVNIAYSLAIIFVITIILLSLFNKKKMTYKKYRTIMTWQGIWVICGIIQFIIPQLLLVSFASVFSVIILYTQLENPNNYIDSTTGVFNYLGLVTYINDRYKYKKPFAAFTVKINYISQMIDMELKTSARFRTATALLNFGSEPVFKIDDDMFCLIYEDQHRMRQQLDLIRQMKATVKDIPATGSYLVIPNSNDFLNTEEFLNFLQSYENISDEILEVTNDLIVKLRRYDIVHDLVENALNEDRVEVFYQPFYNIKTNTFPAAEALVRIRDTDGSIIPPSEFIPISEETGQIIPLGMRIFEKVCQFISENDPKKVGLANIEVNLSAAQFDFENPAKFVIDTIQKYNIDPSMINLEITETAQNKRKNNLIDNINKLREYGITFSLDDFGTGRSNLDYLVDLPIKNIKFDYSFTQGYFNNSKIKRVLEGMTKIMHSMNLNIVSEGIETKEQLDAMLDLGIEYIQGYYFSKPLPKTEFMEFLHVHNMN